MSHPNPFVQHSLLKHPGVSSGTACMMETAWDDAIRTAIRHAQNTRGRIGVGDLRKLLSTNQRVTGPAVPPARRSDYDIGREVEASLTPAQIAEVDELRKRQPVAAIKLAREYAKTGLFEAVRYVRDYLPTKGLTTGTAC